MERKSKRQISCLWLVSLILVGGCVAPKSTPRNPSTANQVHPSKAENEVDVTLEKLGRSQLWLGKKQVWLEVAADSRSRGLGLGRRVSLAKDNGMIFIYGDSKFRSFWMKNTWVALDIAFVSNDLMITQIDSLEPPSVNCSDADMPRAKSRSAARYVVEMRKGWFRTAGVGVGDRIKLSASLQNTVVGVD